MSHRVTLAATLLLLSSARGQRLDKTPLFDNGLPLSDYPDGLTFSGAKYTPVGVPDKCVQEAAGLNGCTVDNIEARQVTYGDCQDTPWILCRCPNATMSMNDLTVRFGYVPPGIRSYVGGLLASNNPTASAGSSGDFIVFNGECVVPVFIHESGHSLDQGTSQSPGWAEAIANSTCVPDTYAQTNVAEDFAQVTVVSTYLAKHGSVPADTSCLQPQLVAMTDARILNAQNSPTCLADKRPFVLAPSAQKPIGAAGSIKAGVLPSSETGSTSTAPSQPAPTLTGIDAPVAPPASSEPASTASDPVTIAPSTASASSTASGSAVPVPPPPASNVGTGSVPGSGAAASRVRKSVGAQVCSTLGLLVLIAIW